MNCPAHICIYNNKIRSYKDLPIRISEFGNCFRIEPSGSLYNLMRTRSFHQDDGHIFCTYEQIENEIENCINIMYKIYNVFNFKNIEVYFSTRPKNKIGDDKI
ncbi:aminoacyl--tRNA ligase-related protein [Candidatus Nardonella dryophthoridicola]|uniref:Aminoacyl-transfer RNA synthetases class-II family profile domain-containing protein n=1 Tax=endosymbiont of Metamasius hemipterus TaxID=204627 RepID=A0ABT0TW43_9GAMM|nr:aminoacyl--tRNA ligase-related protein [Candidatus Nardonella dryophthoridicola]MCM0158223.1 hypothetical protein [endosymbiont of Metamasius hemipterus]